MLTPSLSQNFWQKLTKPIVGFSPMDGVTDAACRAITAKYGKPSITFTEFTAAEGLRAGAVRLLKDFYYSEAERPIVAQIFGADPQAFIGAAAIASALGFDGIDINMGCPAKNVTQHGAGASLIRDPERAKEIIKQTKIGTEAWANGASLEELGVHPAIIAEIEQINANANRQNLPRFALPISVKTRIGYDEICIEEWIGHLLEAKPVAITIHGRTLKQMYTGKADWEAIARGAAVGKNSDTLFLGNGDISSLEDGMQRIQEAKLDGFLVGRAAIGNPWFFTNSKPTIQERLAVTAEHAFLQDNVSEPIAFFKFRKHLIEYTRDMPHAKQVRMALPKVNNATDVAALLATLNE